MPAGRPKSQPSHPDKLVNELVTIIEKSKWTGTELERASGVSQGYISSLRTGRRLNVSLPLFVYLANALNFDVKLVQRAPGRIKARPKPKTRQKIPFAGKD